MTRIGFNPVVASHSKPSQRFGAKIIPTVTIDMEELLRTSPVSI